MAARALLLLFGGLVSVGATDLLVSDRMVRVTQAESACLRVTPCPSGSTQAVSGSDESVMSLRPGLFLVSASAIDVVGALLLLHFDCTAATADSPESLTMRFRSAHFVLVLFVNHCSSNLASACSSEATFGKSMLPHVAHPFAEQASAQDMTV